MPGLIPPDTTSPGRLVLVYHNFETFTDVVHTSGLRFVAGAGYPASWGEADLLARDFAAKLKTILSIHYAIDSWRLLNNDGINVAEGFFSPVIDGTHTVDGVVSAQSPTIAFLGHSRPLIGIQPANAKITVFTGDTYDVPPAEKTLLVSFDPAVEAFAAYLDGHPDFWADVYGTKAICRDYVAVQYNAGVQRKYGA